jgi:hypothetical protein
MTELGKPVVLWLKHMSEMNRLYYPEDYDGEKLVGLDDPTKINEMARAVGDRASDQVAEFLEMCGDAIEKHFASMKIAKPARRRTRSYVRTNWEWGTRVYVPSAGPGWFSCGVYISAPPEVRLSFEKDACGVVVAWLWSRGGRKAGDAVWNILGGRAHSRDSSSITLECIQVKPQPPRSFVVDRDHLLAQVRKVITCLGAMETRAIVKYVSKLRDSDENE